MQNPDAGRNALNLVFIATDSFKNSLVNTILSLK